MWKAWVWLLLLEWAGPHRCTLGAGHAISNPLYEYDEAQALQFLEFARVSFCDDGPLLHWHCGEACDATSDAVILPPLLIGPGEQFRVKGYVIGLRFPGPLNVRRCVLAFRGSVNTENWIADAQLMLTKWPPATRGSLHNETPTTASGAGATEEEEEAPWCRQCQVHGGFAQAYEELRNDTLASVKALGCQLVDVTGHSLGAAVATLAAVDLRASGIQVRMLWTYGSPRVGNPAFVKAFMTLSDDQGAPLPTWRVVHYHDPVPQGGPRTYYEHLPRQVYYQRDSSSYEVCSLHTRDASTIVNRECGMYTLSNMDISGGFVYQDHVSYLNRTLALKDMDIKCVHTNYCIREGRRFDMVHMVSACLVSGILGAAVTPLAWRKATSKKARMSEEETDSSEHSSDNDGSGI